MKCSGASRSAEKGGGAPLRADECNGARWTERRGARRKDAECGHEGEEEEHHVATWSVAKCSAGTTEGSGGQRSAEERSAGETIGASWLAADGRRVPWVRPVWRRVPGSAGESR